MEVFNNSLIINYTKVSIAANKRLAFNWPKAFGTRVCSIANNKRDSSIDNTDNFGCYSANKTGGSFANGNGGTTIYDIISIGY